MNYYHHLRQMVSNNNVHKCNCSFDRLFLTNYQKRPNNSIVSECSSQLIDPIMCNLLIIKGEISRTIMQLEHLKRLNVMRQL